MKNYSDQKAKDRTFAEKLRPKLEGFSNAQLIEYIQKHEQSVLSKRYNRGEGTWTEAYDYNDIDSVTYKRQFSSHLPDYWRNMLSTIETAKAKYKNNLTDKQRVFVINTYLMTMYGFAANNEY